MTNTGTQTGICFCTSYVKITNQDLQTDAYLAELVGEGKFTVVMVLPEIFGVNIHI
jgi:dienelactone hydrolase